MPTLSLHAGDDLAHTEPEADRQRDTQVSPPFRLLSLQPPKPLHGSTLCLWMPGPCIGRRHTGGDLRPTAFKEARGQHGQSSLWRP